ncbi:hypothetical protein [Leifsonia sp. Leaf264]|uniref:hypothetical protein n=1 Tax=Leifsonia sp. Leaf264 TaxID=1736314 RepID=UPI0006F2474F|nr:hypothetical protein [Leifsonia sp. Leaf264]KQO98378.1 hypothetical protein ASF30_09975 [Leifsonia sp. Leaf264]
MKNPFQKTPAAPVIDPATPRSFYRTHRMGVQARTFKTGFDSHVQLEYMGATEFESPGRHLRELRAAGEIVTRSKDVTRDGNTVPVHFAGPAQSIDQAIEAFSDWVAEPHIDASEYTRLEGRFSGDLDDHLRRTDAWWAYDAKLMWTFDENLVGELVAAINDRPAT